MARPMKKSNTLLARWLRKHKVTIKDIAEDIDVCYRTAWIATHAIRRVDYGTAIKINQYTKGAVSVKSLCEVRPH